MLVIIRLKTTESENAIYEKNTGSENIIAGIVKKQTKLNGVRVERLPDGSSIELATIHRET